MNSSCGQIIFVSISDMEFLENDGNICTEVYGNTYACVFPLGVKIFLISGCVVCVFFYECYAFFCIDC